MICCHTDSPGSCRPRTITSCIHRVCFRTHRWLVGAQAEALPRPCRHHDAPHTAQRLSVCVCTRFTSTSTDPKAGHVYVYRYTPLPGRSRVPAPCTRLPCPPPRAAASQGACTSLACTQCHVVSHRLGRPGKSLSGCTLHANDKILGKRTARLQGFLSATPTPPFALCPSSAPQQVCVSHAAVGGWGEGAPRRTSAARQAYGVAPGLKHPAVATRK